MTRLRVGDRSIALEIADSPRARARGLLGRDGLVGAIQLTPARAVHTFGMRFAIDVAHVDASARVLSTTTMAPNRLGRPRLRARSIIEAEAGAFAAWGLTPGVTVTVVDQHQEAA